MCVCMYVCVCVCVCVDTVEILEGLQIIHLSVDSSPLVALIPGSDRERSVQVSLLRCHFYITTTASEHIKVQHGASAVNT
jgi:hypothetical protein